MDDALLAALGEKYRELVALRSESAGDVRPRLRALAARFPGALRELDEQPLPELVARREALADALSRRAPVPAWAPWMASYHGLLRVALRLKRTGCDAARVVISYMPESADEPERLSHDDVAAMLAPPNGRLSAWALARVALLHGVSEREVSSILFARRA